MFEGKTGFLRALFEFNSLDLVGFGEVLTPDVAFLTDDPFSPAPVPLPAALPMLAGAFGLLGLVRRRARGARA